MLRQAAHADDHVYFFLGHVLTALVMQLSAGGAQLEHLARDHDAAAGWERGERIYHSIQSFWIGIVAIVDDRGTGNLDDLPTILDSMQSRQGFRCGGEWKAAIERYRNRSQRIVDVVLAHEGQLDWA